MYFHHAFYFLTLYQLLDFHKFFQLRNLIGNVVMNILYEFIYLVKSVFFFIIEKFIFRQII